MTAINFGIASNPARDGSVSAARIINGFVEAAGAESKTPYPVYSSPGYKRFGTIDIAAGERGMIVVGDTIYAVIGTQVLKIGVDGSFTVLGGLTGTGPVFMARNNRTIPQVGVVANGQYFIIEGTSFSQVTDPDVGVPNGIASIDGYFVLTQATGKFVWTALNDGNTIAALDFANAESDPDGLSRPFKYGSDLALFGTETIEIWRNTGNVNGIFEPLQGVNITKGTVSPHSVVEIDNALIFVDHLGVVRRMRGDYNPVKISPVGLDLAISGLSEGEKQGLKAHSYSVQGHEFYSLSSSTFTWEFDASTGQWHERESYQVKRWNISNSVFLGGKVIFGHYNIGRLYELDTDMGDEDGAHIIFDVRSPIMHAFPYRTVIDRLSLDLVVGRGKTSTDTLKSDPKITLRYSDDGGHSWSVGRDKSIGKIGDFIQSVTFRSLGMTKRGGRIWRITSASPVLRGINSADVIARRSRI